jgi:integrase
LTYFLKVIAFLKRNAVGYEAKKSKVLTREEVNTFLKETDDNVYLLMKVALLFGICGACRREELHSLHVGDIVEQGSSLFITLSDTKTHSKRVFSVTADGEAVNALELYSVETTYGINSVISKLVTFVKNAETGRFLFLMMLILSCFTCT